MNNKKRTIEVIVILVVIVLAVLFVWWKKAASNDIKQTALIEELRAVRVSVGAYLEINKHYPNDLKTLASATFSVGGASKPFLSGLKLNKEGAPIDAFGKTFNYDPKTGRVWPSETKYAQW